MVPPTHPCHRRASLRASFGAGLLALAALLVVAAPAEAQGTYQILYSLTPDRANPLPLGGAVVQGAICAFTSPDAGVTRVRFYLDDPNRTGSPFRTETGAPFDFNGGSAALATPYPTTSIPDGAHTITAAITPTSGGTIVVHATFTVANVSQLAFAPPSLAIALPFGGSAAAEPVSLAGTPPGATFAIAASAPWLDASPATGTAPALLSVAVDAAGLLPGTHSATIVATAAGYLPATLAVVLTVSPPPPIVVDTLVDEADGSCADGDCSLRDALAIAAADGIPSEVRFAVDGTIALALGALAVPAGNTLLTGAGRAVTIAAPPSAPWPVISISSGDNRIESLAIAGGAHGIAIAGSDNAIEGVEVSGAGGAGIRIPAAGSVRNSLRNCRFHGNGGLAIDLGAAGPGLGGIAVQGGIAPPVLNSAAGSTIAGTSVPGAEVAIYAADPDPSGAGEGETLVATVTAGASGSFSAALLGPAEGTTWTALATDPAGNTSEFAANRAGEALGFDLLFSRSPDRSAPAPLAGRVLSGPICVFTAPDAGVDRVLFHLDDPPPLGTPFRIEGNPPYDFAGGSAAAATPYATGSLADGVHTITAVLELDAGPDLVITSSFIVANSPAPPGGIAYPGPLAPMLGEPLAPVLPASTGGPVESWSVAPPLPAGLALDPVTGAIAGIPTVAAAAQMHIVTATNAAGSAAASLSVAVTSGAPEIVAGPASLTLCPGAPALFTVAVAASTPFSLQWRKDGAPLPGETAASLAIAAVGSGDAGSYDVVVEHAGGSIASEPALLVVLAPPAILPAPPALAACAGAPVTLSATVSGSPPVALSWRKDGAPIPGADTSTLAIAAASAADAGSYELVATNACGTATGAPTVLAIESAPSIVASPADLTRCAGEGAVFTVAATGATPLGVEWWKDGAPLPGATSEVLALPAVAAADAGDYIAVVTNGCGTATSAAATLVVGTAPAIVADPVSQSACAGAEVILDVVTDGAGALPGGFTVEWRKDGDPIPGATGESLVIPAFGAADAGSYDAVVANGCGAATSAPATLTLRPALVVTSGPGDRELCAGEPLLLEVAATGAGAIAVEWRRDGAPIPGANGGAYEILSATAADAGAYEAILTDDCGSAASAPATVVVHALPAIAAHPAGAALCEGAPALLAVTATGAPPLAFQWRRDGIPLAGENAETLALAAVGPAEAGSYDVVVASSCGEATSAAATIALLAPPSLLLAPADVVAGAGETVAFAVAAEGAPPLAIRWRKDGVEIPGATSADLVIAAVGIADEGAYDAIVANPCGALVSPAATLTVILPEAPASVSYPSPLSFLAEVAIAPVAPVMTGGAATGFAIDPPLPAGLALDAASGVISGIPVAASPATSHVITAANAGGSATTTVVIEVAPNIPYRLLVSDLPTFADPVPLEGAWVNGDIHVRLEPTEDVVTVTFHLDDPFLAGTPYGVEGAPPFDLAGGTTTVANPLDTTELAEGPHRVTAVVEVTGGEVHVIEALFTVQNIPNVIRWDPPEVVIHVEPGGTGPRSATVRVAATDGAVVPFTISAPAVPWLAHTPGAATLPAAVEIVVTVDGLAPGLHETTVTAATPVHDPVALRIVVAVESGTPGRALSVSRHGITWTFAADAEVGTFVGGDPYVIGPVTIAAIEPPWDGTHHGSMIDPVHGETHGYDARFSFDPALRAPVPGTILPGRSIVSVESWRADDPAAPSSANTLGIPRPALRRGAVLTALADHPPAGTFRPAYGGGEKRLFHVSELRTDLLPSLPLVAGAPDPLETAADLERLWIDHLRRFVGRYLHPSENMADYDRDFATDYNVAALLALCDIPPAEREALLIRLVQIGIDMHAILESGATWGDGGGGFGSGRKWAILFSGILLDDPAMQGIGGGYGPVHALEDCQTYFLTAGDGGTSEFTAPAAVGLSIANLYASSQPDRSQPTLLHGAEVEGDVYIFAAQGTGIRRVLFYLDDPNTTGAPDQIENNPPYDLEGGSAAVPNPLDTLGLANGTHSVTARYEYTAGGSTTVTAYFEVANQGPVLEADPAELVVEAGPEGSTAGASITISSHLGAAVAFEVASDDPWLAVTPGSGTTPATIAVAIDASGLAPGTHASSITATSPDHAPVTIAVTLDVPGPVPASVLVVDTLADELDGSCDDGDCSLRDALDLANTNDDDDEIRFAVSGSIALILGSLPLTEDRTRLIGEDRTVTIDAAGLAGLPALEVLADDCVVRGLVISGATAGAPGVVVGGGRNTLDGNRITANSGAGIAVPAGAGARNSFRGNEVHGNGGLAIDLGADGPGNAPDGPNAGIQSPELEVITTQAIHGSTGPGAHVELFLAPPSGSGGLVLLGTATADAQGSFTVPVPGLAVGTLLTATATASLPVGTPVWGDRHCFPQGDYQDPGNLAYRTCCTANAWVGAALGAHILGARALWNHEPFFDYMDLYMDEREPGEWQRSWSSFAEAMWDAYRADYGPVWPETAGGGG